MAAVASAQGLDRAQPLQESAQELALESAGVPTSANWVVLDASGIAAWRAQGESRWHRFTRGEVLPAGSEIETGSDGEITLVAGRDQLTIAPQGRLIVPFARPGQDRRLRHERGRILVQIESRPARNVRVDTPLLSLGIKGTSFEVAVDPEQNTVVVHEGEVEVTTPSQADPVDLGAGEGLRQSVVPGDGLTRFSLPAPATPPGSADQPAWRLPPSGTSVRAEQETSGAATPPDAAAATTSSDAAARSHSDRTGEPGGRLVPASARAEKPFGWLDDVASSWAYVAIAGVALLVLTIPGLALLQNLREQWRSRPGGKGRRRRDLVRG
jgi:hypothetical protein